MAVQFHELPPEVFPDAARPHIARLNRELRELFALEGVIRQPRSTKRSDDSIVRRSEVQVDVSRITPSLSAAVAGSSAVIGAPNLTFSTTNVVGTTRTVVSVNSTVALFDTTAPSGISNTAAVGTAAFASRRDHRHDHPVFSTGDLHTDLLPLSGVRDMTGEIGTDVGTFRSDVASGGVGFIFNTSNSFAAGTLFSFRDNGTRMFEQNFEGHASIMAVEGAPSANQILLVQRALLDDNRAAFRGIDVQASVTGTIVGAAYSPTVIGVNCNATFAPTSFATPGTRTIRGGQFTSILNSTDTSTVQNAGGGLFAVNDLGGQAGLVSNAICGDFQISGTFAGGLTNAYGVRTQAITIGTNRWGGNFGNRVAITSPAADAQEVLNLTQSNTGATAGVHLKLNDKAGDPAAPAAGDIWRNGDELFIRTTARNEGIVGFLARARWAVD